MVLGRGAGHRRAADVDGLDAGDSRERVEVRHHEVERLDAVLLEVGVVRLLAAVGEDAAVDVRVQRDHAVVEHLGKPVMSASEVTGMPASCDRPGGAARRHELHAAAVELAGELDDAGLVVDREQRAALIMVRLIPASGASTSGRYDVRLP